MSNTIPEQSFRLAAHTRGDMDGLISRYERRRSNRLAEFPPDFIHGDASLDELYDAFGEEWVESAAFIQHHVSADGTLCGVSVAMFTDWFLAVEHATVSELGSAAALQQWLGQRLESRRVVLELQTSGECRGIEGGKWIDMNCSIERLLELEQNVVHVHRDGSHDWMTHAQTNLLSLITLSGRLGLGLGLQ